jgi:hypothetical protein
MPATASRSSGAPRLLRAFLDRPQEKLDTACLAEIPAPTFQLGAAGPQP